MKNKMEDYLGNLDDLKTKIAKMCIDWTGVIESDYHIERENPPLQGWDESEQKA